MDKVIFYTMILSVVVFGGLMYLLSQRDVEPTWSARYVPPTRPSFGAMLRQSEVWLFVVALLAAAAVVNL